MTRIENTGVYGFEAAIRGMRNQTNSWDKSDSHVCACADGYLDCPMVLNDDEPAKECDPDKYNFCVGEKDFCLMKKLAAAGPDHGKFLRMIIVTLDITAPLYWWKEFDTYKVGTVANSCSTMHKIADKAFTLDDFSCEHLLSFTSEGDERKIPFVDVSPYSENNITFSPTGVLECIIIPILNRCRDRFLETKDKKYWWQMIQLLPSSYNQRRTVQLNYAVLKNIYHARKSHKLDEWRYFCQWMEALPYSELITRD